MLHMPEREVLHTRVGKMDDFIACHYIANGADPLTQTDDEIAIPDIL